MMESELEDVWYNWLGTSYRQIGFLKSNTKPEKGAGALVINKKPVSKVEQHIHNLTESLSKTQAALERAGLAEEEARKEHAGCSETLAKQANENVRLEQEMEELAQEIESCHWKQGSDAVTHERLEHRIRELVAQVKRAEKDAEENRGIMDNERLIHLQGRETLRVVQTEHEDCLASLRVAQDILSEYSRDVEHKDAAIQELRRHKSKMASKISHITSSLRTTSKELNKTKTRLSHVSEQLKQAENIIQTHFAMLSSLETYKHSLTEELDHLRSSYEKRTLQLVSMRETLQDRNRIIAELRDKLEERDTELETTNMHAAAVQDQLATTLYELTRTRSAAASAENVTNEIRDYHTKIDADKARQLSELTHDKNELKNVLELAQQENASLKGDLANAAIEAAAKDDILSQEIAAHSRTTEAAAAQKLRLQNSIENLRMNLNKANGDLRRTRETLFALNEKCHNFARAQVSLSSYRAKSRLLLDKGQSPERHAVPTDGKRSDQSSTNDFDKGSEKSSDHDCDKDTISDIEKDSDKNFDKAFSDDSDQGSCNDQASDEQDVSFAFTLKVKPDESIIRHRAHARHISFADSGIGSTASTPTTEAPPMRIALPARDSFMEPLQVATPKSVRFSLASDEGYQTDEEKATTSDGQIWSIISDLDRARKDYKVLRKRQRRRNLKSDSCASQ